MLGDIKAVLHETGIKAVLHETAARAPTRMPCLRKRRRSARLPPRPDAERYVHTVRELMFPIGDVAVGIGSHS